MDEISPGSEIGGPSKGSEIETDEIGDVGLSCCQLCMSGSETEGENVCIVSVLVFGYQGHLITDLQAS